MVQSQYTVILECRGVSCFSASSTFRFHLMVQDGCSIFCHCIHSQLAQYPASSNLAKAEGEGMLLSFKSIIWKSYTSLMPTSGHMYGQISATHPASRDSKEYPFSWVNKCPARNCTGMEDRIQGIGFRRRTGSLCPCTEFHNNKN